MNFSSPVFLFCFLPILLIGFFVLPITWRKAYLCLVSGLFYAWDSPFKLLVLLVFISVNYILAVYLRKSLSTAQQKAPLSLWFAMGFNLLFLGYIKYSGLMGEALTYLGLPIRVSAVENIPLGISFFTFSAISFHLDLYYGKTKSCPSWLDFSFYILFFPKLLQGPIARFNQLLNQSSSKRFDLELVSAGCVQFVFGLAQKVLIADQFSQLVEKVFHGQIAQIPLSVAWLGALAFTFQIYFDFSGYTDMAIGLGKILGYQLPINFSYPYISHSITEFWRRWHITLGQFFRDYVFMPLEMKTRHRRYLRFEINTLIVFFLTGLWHGASWQFIFWGLWQGVWIIFENQPWVKERYKNLPGIVTWGITMLAVIIGWVIFRAPDLGSGIHLLKIMFGVSQPLPSNLSFWWYCDRKIAFLLIISVVFSLPIGKIISSNIRMGRSARNVVVYLSFFVLLIISLLQVMSSSIQTFIYFNF